MSQTDFKKTSPPLLRPQGADPLPAGGVRYRIWAPDAENPEVVFFDKSGKETDRKLSLNPEQDGFFSNTDPNGKQGDRYKFKISGELFPDPFSRWQPNGIEDPSMVIDSGGFHWEVSKWKRIPLNESVIYELHVGTFTREGTFLSAINRLDHLVSLGITTIELMPIAAFAGKRNWGYDGVMLFAPDSSYGHPDDLRKLVDAIHLRGLNVILDVVYNHFGPDGNYLASYSPDYFDPELKTPWGDAIRFSGHNSRYVRGVFLANVEYWLKEFRFDGFRLDATHQILDSSTPHILSEIARTAHRYNAIVIAEDERNLTTLAEPHDGFGLDGLWADDFHHSVRVALTGENEDYLGNFTGSSQELAETLQGGWYFRGQVAPASKSERGTPPESLKIKRFIHCITNHDQVGNHAFGERLHQLVSPEAYRAASALLCLTPGTPMIFMGQEWAADSPFLYFTDHKEELGELVQEGRRQEFEAFLQKAKRENRSAELPNPQAESTFQQSKLQWEEISKQGHAEVLRLYREFLKLRSSEPAVLKRSRQTVQTAVLGNGVVALEFQETIHSGLLVLISLTGNHRWNMKKNPFGRLAPGWTWKPVLSSNEIRFGGDGSAAFNNDSADFHFKNPETLVLRPIQST